MVVTLAIVGVIALVALFFFTRWVRQPGIKIVQWGKFENERVGIKSHAIWADESTKVKFDDYKFWVRFKPNPGVNLPIIGYWSKARGRNK